MNTKWQIEKWETPLSEVRSLALVSLLDDNENLDIVVEAAREPGRPRWLFRFINYPGYRNLMEEFRLELWRHLDDTDQRCGSTFTVRNSPWLTELAGDEPLLEVKFPKAQHFVITTEDDVVEVLSPEPASIQSLGPAPQDARAAGKSEVYYAAEDRIHFDDIRGKD